ncbi:hypothetical protein L3X38_006018 [Prunus dulcis]|uniref:Uncharacterized protein n=1 Tax=Prunus dulcis TaxID=3755 RepID=A0AAD4ZRW4_PRUDU|nr:hypothetical protein L3X38_006018 [Prunus dulcis]
MAIGKAKHRNLVSTTVDKAEHRNPVSMSLDKAEHRNPLSMAVDKAEHRNHVITSVDKAEHRNLLQMGWAAVKSELMRLTPVPEFKDQGSRMLRKDSEALGNTLVTFTNKNNNSLQINSWLGMRSLWHGS